MASELSKSLQMPQSCGKEQSNNHVAGLRAGKTSLMICPRHEEARKVATIVRQKLKAEGAIGTEDHAVTVLSRMDLGPESRRDLLHYAPGRVAGFHTRTSGGFKPGEKWTVSRANCETVTLERNGKLRHFMPSARGKWDVLVSWTMRVSAGDQISCYGRVQGREKRLQEQRYCRGAAGYRFRACAT